MIVYLCTALTTRSATSSAPDPRPQTPDTFILRGKTGKADQDTAVICARHRFEAF